jgi:hypothetical protein
MTIENHTITEQEAVDGALLAERWFKDAQAQGASPLVTTLALACVHVALAHSNAESHAGTTDEADDLLAELIALAYANIARAKL